MKRKRENSPISLVLFIAAAGFYYLSIESYGKHLEAARQLRNEVQEYNIRFEKVVKCFRDIAGTDNDCSVQFDFEEVSK